MFFENSFSVYIRALCIFTQQPSELPCSLLEWDHLFSSDFEQIRDEVQLPQLPQRPQLPNSFLSSGPLLNCLLLGIQGIFSVTFGFLIIYVDN